MKVPILSSPQTYVFSATATTHTHTHPYATQNHRSRCLLLGLDSYLYFSYFHIVTFARRRQQRYRQRQQRQQHRQLKWLHYIRIEFVSFTQLPSSVLHELPSVFSRILLCVCVCSCVASVSCRQTHSFHFRSERKIIISSFHFILLLFRVSWSRSLYKFLYVVTHKMLGVSSIFASIALPSCCVVRRSD